MWWASTSGNEEREETGAWPRKVAEVQCCWWARQSLREIKEVAVVTRMAVQLAGVAVCVT